VYRGGLFFSSGSDTVPDGTVSRPTGETGTPLPRVITSGGDNICVGVRLRQNYWRENEAPRKSYLMAFPRVGSDNDLLIPAAPNACKPRGHQPEYSHENRGLSLLFPRFFLCPLTFNILPPLFLPFPLIQCPVSRSQFFCSNLAFMFSGKFPVTPLFLNSGFHFQ